jgi:hypothetical protein
VQKKQPLVWAPQRKWRRIADKYNRVKEGGKTHENNLDRTEETQMDNKERKVGNTGRKRAKSKDETGTGQGIDSGGTEEGSCGVRD